MASLSNVINVALLPEGAAVQKDNMNVCLVVTSDTGFLSSSKRYEIYKDAESVATDFGTDSKAYAHALVFFAQTPNPINANGLFIVGHWRAADETVAATAGKLTGGQVTESEIIPILQGIQDGSFNITIDGGVEENVTGLDLRTITTIEELVAILNTNITGATVTYSNGSLIVTSDTTGATSAVTLLTAGATGTFIGEILKLAAGSGAVTVAGEASDTLTAETKTAAITAIREAVAFRGFVFADSMSDADSTAIATWAQANGALTYDVFSDATNLEVDVTNPVWTIKLANQTNCRMLYSKVGDRKLATAYMARMHTVNFAGVNTAITMNLKELRSVVAEDYTQTEITKAKTVGLDLYTTFKNVSKLLTSGANDFTDNVYNLLAFIDAVQTDAFNLLATTSTKIPQTNAGVNQLVDAVEKSCQGFVTSGVFAPGTWTSSDRFGDQEVFDANIEGRGFYVLAGTLADQSQDDRQARKAPVIQTAVKNAGAIHSADIIIFFNL